MDFQPAKKKKAIVPGCSCAVFLSWFYVFFFVPVVFRMGIGNFRIDMYSCLVVPIF